MKGVQNISDENYSDQLRESAEETGTIICLGYDPAPSFFGDVYEENGIKGYDPQLQEPGTDISVTDAAIISMYLENTLDALEEAGTEVAASKPNSGYFGMYGANGEIALDQCLALLEDVPGPTILDAKINDIGRSMAARTEATLGRPTVDEHVDAITVNPLMGSDNIEPAARKAHENGDGIYVLTRTTNPGAEDLLTQDVVTDSGTQPMYMEIADNVVEWNQEYGEGSVGAVVAGNEPEELQKIAERFAEAPVDVPMLIPGVGTQGGEADEVVRVLNESGVDPRLSRINLSSGIMYALQKDDEDHRDRESHGEKSAEVVEELNEQIEF